MRRGHRLAVMAKRKKKRGPKPWQWQAEYDLAAKLLESYPGKIERATDAYVAFRYLEPDLRIVFYPHTTKGTGNKHIRVRCEPCKRKAEALEIMKMLDREAGHNCTFSAHMGAFN